MISVQCDEGRCAIVRDKVDKLIDDIPGKLHSCCSRGGEVTVRKVHFPLIEPLNIVSNNI